MGEVSGAKMAAALELAAEDNRNGIPTQAVLCLETGGVRLQEANLGLAAIADIHAAIVDLRRYTPVVGIIAGTVGCFGGMSIAAALCSYLIVTREARLGLNGPQVIEQEAGIEEYDSRNRPFIWSMTGGEIRAASGLVDALVNDGVNAVKTAMNEAIAKGVPVQHRSDNYDDYLRRLSQFDTRQQADTAQIKQLLPGRINNESVPKPRRAVAEQTGARRAADERPVPFRPWQTARLMAKTCVLSPWSRMLTTTTRVPPAAKLACWKAGRWRKWLMKPLPPTPTSQSNGRSSP